MLTGPSPTLTSLITYSPEVETGMLTLAMPLEEEFTVPSTLPLGSITASVYGTLTSASAATEKPSAFERTRTFCSSDWPRARALVLVVVVPGPAVAMVLDVALVMQNSSTYAGPFRLTSSKVWKPFPVKLYVTENLPVVSLKNGSCIEPEPAIPALAW